MAPPPEAEELLEITIDAAHIEGDQHRVEARGNVRVRAGEDTLTADQATADLDTNELAAEGSVTLSRAGEVIQGERVRYNWETREGRAENARTVVRNVILRAKELTTTARRADAMDARATTCDLPRPHYRITARRIVLFPRRRLVAYSASIWLGKTRLLTVPRHEVSLQRGEASQSPFPSIGFNRRDGLTLRKSVTIVDQPSLLLDLNTTVAFRRGLLGGIEATCPGSPAFIAAATFREDAPSQRIRFLEVSRLPEVGVAISSPARARRPRRVPTQAQSVRSETDPTDRTEQTSRRWEWAAQGTIGYFRQRRDFGPREERFDRDGGRLDLRALAARRNVRLGPIRLSSVGLLARVSWYHTGERFSLLGVATGDSWRLGKNVNLSLRRFMHVTEGSTPFRFDSPDLRNEWRPGIGLTLGKTSLAWEGRYDENRGGFFDQEFVLARKVHCLEPRVSYRTRRRQWGLDIRIIGLRSAKPAEEESPGRPEEMLEDTRSARRQ
jgi:hypothetical protein